MIVPKNQLDAATSLRHMWTGFDCEYSLDRPENHPPDYYGYWPASISKFLGFLNSLPISTHNKVFLDIGCGIGDKVFLAYSLYEFKQSVGLEVSPEYHAIAKYLHQTPAYKRPLHRLNPLQDLRFIRADALDYCYKDYDVMYWFNPILNPEVTKQILLRILNDMKIGACLISYGIRGLPEILQKISPRRFKVHPVGLVSAFSVAERKIYTMSFFENIKQIPR